MQGGGTLSLLAVSVCCDPCASLPPGPAALAHSGCCLLRLVFLCQILIRLSKLCVQESASVRKSRKQQQRLLRNMGAHAVVLELLQIPYEKVGTPTAVTVTKAVSGQVHEPHRAWFRCSCEHAAWPLRRSSVVSPQQALCSGCSGAL